MSTRIVVRDRVLILSCTEEPTNGAYRVRVAIGSVKGTVYARVDTKSVVYPRFSRLGEILHRNSQGERKTIAEKIRALTGRSDLAEWFYGLP
jgi:hypothetical protein